MRAVPRRSNIVIVEGTCGSGKTTLLRAAESMFESSTVLYQRTTYAPIAPPEDDGTLDDDSDRSALLDVVRRIHDESASKQLVLVDTLHATHFVRAGVLTLPSFVEIDRALNDLGALVVVLRISEDAIRQRTVEDRRGSGFYEYAKKFGRTEEDRTSYFAREQSRLLDLLARHSRLPHIVLDGEEPIDSLRVRFHRAVRHHVNVRDGLNVGG
jgi:thymidylate kinase